MIKEFCSENHIDVAKAISMGAQRVELCDNLAVGGRHRVMLSSNMFVNWHMSRMQQS